MQFNTHNFALSSPESWLIILIYAGFLVCSYFSLVKLLIHLHQQDAIDEQDSVEAIS